MKRLDNIRMIGISLAVIASLALAFVAGRMGSRPLKVKPESVEKRLNISSTRSRDAMREATSGGDAASRTLILLDRLDDCRSREDFLLIIEVIESTADKSEKSRYLATVFAAWLEVDPLAALAEVRRVESLRHDTERVAESFSRWASSDPASAADVLAKALDGRQKNPKANPLFLDGVDPPVFLLSLVAGLGQSDPRLAADTLGRCTASPARTAAIEVLLQDWYPADPAAVLGWAAAIKDPGTRRIAIAAAATKAGQQDDTAAGIAWAMKLTEPSEREVALHELTGQWSQRHAADAFAWTRSIPDESLKLSLMPQVISQLTIIDPGAAADWLNQFEASPAMDASVAAYARAIQSTNPQAALGSAAAITDPKLRDHVQKSILRNQAQ